jgi:hypothetical protein
MFTFYLVLSNIQSWYSSESNDFIKLHKPAKLTNEFAANIMTKGGDLVGDLRFWSLVLWLRAVWSVVDLEEYVCYVCLRFHSAAGGRMLLLRFSNPLTDWGGGRITKQILNLDCRQNLESHENQCLIWRKLWTIRRIVPKEILSHCLEKIS